MLISCGFVFLIRHFNSRSNLVLLKKLILEPVCERTQYSNIHTNNIQETCYWLAYNLIWIIWDWNQVVVYDQRYFMKFLNYNWNLTYGWCILYHAATKSSSSLELACIGSIQLYVRACIGVLACCDSYLQASCSSPCNQMLLFSIDIAPTLVSIHLGLD